MLRKVTFVEFSDQAIRITYQQEGDKEVVARAIVVKPDLIKPFITQFFQTVLNKIMDEERLEALTEEQMNGLIKDLLNGGTGEKPSGIDLPKQS